LHESKSLNMRQYLATDEYFMHQKKKKKTLVLNTFEIKMARPEFQKKKKKTDFIKLIGIGSFIY
jgi:hypothetical protein